MADFSKFRTAVSGFNRTDVVNYIESTSIEHQKALRKLTDERDKLAAENARLQVELAGLQKRLEQAQADNDALSGQVNALAQEGSDLAEQLKKAEEAQQELLTRPDPQPSEPVPQPEEPETENEPDEPVQEPSLTEKELTAYRRAEQTERNAAVRARRIYAQLSNLCEDARTRYMDSGEEIAALAADLSTGLSRPAGRVRRGTGDLRRRAERLRRHAAAGDSRGGNSRIMAPLKGSWRAAPEGLQQAGAKSIDRCTPVCTTKFHCRGRCLHRPAQIAPVLREFSANSLYFLGRQSRRPLQRPPLSPVGADDSVRPQNVPVLRKSAANSQLPSGPMWASAPTGLPQIRTAL